MAEGVSLGAMSPNSAKRPFLILDAYLDELGGARNFVQRLGARESVVVRAAKGEVLPRTAEGLAGILVSGSAASMREPPDWALAGVELTRDALRRGVPYLGLCFGHQLLACAAAGLDAVVLAQQPELGWVEIERSQEAPLLAQEPARFVAFESHRDEVRPNLPELKVFAANAACAVQGFQVRGSQAFGVQFHPEMGLEESTKLIAERAAGDPGRIAELSAAKLDTSTLGDRILEQFLQLAEAPN